jgi:predicted Zn-dependent protease
MTDADVIIDNAVDIINSGQAPMEGILALKELADADEPNLRANMLLGKFSVQSGQAEKARERFLKVLELEPNHLEATWDFAMLNMKMGALEDAVEGFKICVAKDETLANGYFFMAQCFEAMENNAEALKAYKTYLPLAPDTVVSKSVEDFINRLEVGAAVANDPNT